MREEIMMDAGVLLRNIMSENDIEGILLTDPYSIRYYTGFSGEGVAVVTETSSVILTDSRYTEAAGQESNFEVQTYTVSVSQTDLLREILKKDNVRKLGFENESISYADYKKYIGKLSADAERQDKAEVSEAGFSDWYADAENKAASGVRLVPLGNSLLLPRQIKSPAEIELLRHAEHIGDLAFQDVLGILKPGMTELEVAAELEYSMKRHGAEGLSFETIAASGMNSSKPHAVPTLKKLEMGDFLTMDFGCRYKGYCSDMTRTVCIGKASDEQKKVYEIVRMAQAAVLEKVHAGLICKDVDAIARNMIKDAGYGDYFGHGLGHSVGLYIHESPAFNTRDDTVLRAGMVITDEPGIYLPGKFGVRIEDMILITEDGYENLATSPKELIEL